MPRRRGFGKRKGSLFEREVCTRLSLWVTRGKRRDVFWRSAMSGGRATLGKRRGHDLSRQAGDICSVAPEGHDLTDRYFLELKHYRDPKLQLFILEGRGPIAGWWAKAVREAEAHSRIPVLILKGNKTPILVLTQSVNILNPQPVAQVRKLWLGLFNRAVRQPWKVPPLRMVVT